MDVLNNDPFGTQSVPSPEPVDSTELSSSNAGVYGSTDQEVAADIKEVGTGMRSEVRDALANVEDPNAPKLATPPADATGEWEPQAFENN